MTAWVAIAAVGLGAFALRVVPVALLAGRPLPPSIGRALRFTGPAALTALVATALTGHDDGGGVGDVFAVVAVAVSAGIMARYRSMPLAGVAGVATYFVGTAAVAAWH